MSQDIPKLPRCKADDDNMEKLHQAARRGQTELVRRLVGSGIPLSIPNKFGCTALHLAARGGHTLTVKELGPKANLSAGWHGRRALHLAAVGGHKDAVIALVEAAKSQNITAEAFLSENDDCEVLEVGKFHKVCIGQTALHWAVGLQSKEMVTLLISLGTPVMVRDREGESPICRAIEFGDEEIFDVLMAGKPKLDVTDKYSRSALHWAINHQRLTMVAKLLTAGCDVADKDSEGRAPLVTAAANCNLKVMQEMIKVCENESFYSLPIHDGKNIQEDKIGFVKGSQDEKFEILKELQTKFEMAHKERDAAKAKGRDFKKEAPLHLAPSAPLRK